MGVDRRSLRRWKAAARAQGEAGVRAKPGPPGRPPKLLAKHRSKLEALLLKGAQAAGYHTNPWTCPRVAEVIERRFGVGYHVDHIGRLLHELGWSPQKSARRSIERDEQAIRCWVHERWPLVKKTPPSVARRSSSSMKPAS